MNAIRKYETKDDDDIVRVWYKASELAHPFLKKDFLKKEEQNIRNIYLPNTETWVYEVNDEVLGFVALIGNEVGALFLDPDFHGHGIGYRLMKHVSKLHKELEVEVFKKNSIGRGFYKRFGFKYLSEGVHEGSGCDFLRLKYTSNTN